MLDAEVVANSAPWKNYMVLGKLVHGPNEWETLNYVSEPITQEQAEEYLNRCDVNGWELYERIRIVLVSQEWKNRQVDSTGGVSCTNA